MDVAGKHVVVTGVGVTGRAVAVALIARGASVLVIDDGTGPRQQAAAEQLRGAGVDVTLRADETVDHADLVVASPGWRLDHPLLVDARARDIEVIGEPELAWRLRPAGAAAWLGVTGTNGKTTTVGMLEACLRSSGLRAIAAGNVGLALTEAVLADPPYDVLAVEISSQQLQWSPSVRFHAGAILNIAQDHLDWHDTMEAYTAAKARIWIGAIAIGSADDDAVRAMLPPTAVTFSTRDPVADYTVVDGRLVESASGESLVAVDELQVVGDHNVANALAAAALARAYEVPIAAVADGLRGYAPGRHRNQRITEVTGVVYVDDSKATNPHAAAASLAAYPSVVWIAGGLLKGTDVDPLVATHAARLRAVVLIGRDRGLIADALARHAPDVPVLEVAATDTSAMDEAVHAAARLAHAGDTVLLAPAAASWDMFRDYAERGDRFADAARTLVAG